MKSKNREVVIRMNEKELEKEIEPGEEDKLPSENQDQDQNFFQDSFFREDRERERDNNERRSRFVWYDGEVTLSPPLTRQGRASGF